MWAKLRRSLSSSSSSSPPRSGEAPPMAIEYITKSKTPLTVEEEYNMALRTKSFLDIWAKAHHHNKPQHAEAEAEADAEAEAEAEAEEEEKRNSHPSSCSFSSSCNNHSSLKVTEFVLEPSQDSLRAATARIRLHRRRALLLDYFDATSEACGACVALLSSVHRARCHHRRIRRLLLRLSLNAHSTNTSTNTLSNKGERPNTSINTNTLSDEGQRPTNNKNNWITPVSRELARHVDGRDNPLSAQSLARFHHAHARYAPLAARRLARRARSAGRILLLGACGGSAGKGKSKNTAKKKGKAEVDAAAKGAYIVGRDLDTVSRMVRRAHDEVEHGRDVARIALRAYDGGGGGGGGGGREVAREAAREVEFGAVELAEQLAELEEHVCLCLITINRSRRLVAREIMTTTAQTPFF
ncbi:LOW QUALITY PROTEIN: putative UPF0496 protein 2 [Ananas comosus]|uniref:LOW QUALITY PROTEIN: putative UPF0496 protein 2 n=1 Tax=Ananas comosus TaxID=4615 RepID=A0A6P5H781_ANACO|nr:LOW QUALITY PROTEIN: putative UPF0496 protein 2 [Ananas comosus]